MSKLAALSTRRYGSLAQSSLGTDLVPTSVTVKTVVADNNPLDVVLTGIAAVQAAIANAMAGGATTQSVTAFKSGGSISMSDFKTVGGVCRPMDFPARDYVREMQKQMNRVAHVKGFKKVAPDGAVGPATLSLLKQIQTIAGGDVMGDTSACIYVAADADVIGDQVKSYANGIGAPATVGSPPAVSTVVTATGQQLTVPPSAGIGAGVNAAFAGMTGTQKVMLAGMAGGIAYLIHKKMKRKRR